MEIALQGQARILRRPCVQHEAATQRTREDTRCGPCGLFLRRQILAIVDGKLARRCSTHEHNATQNRANDNEKSSDKFLKKL